MQTASTFRRENNWFCSRRSNVCRSLHHEYNFSQISRLFFRSVSSCIPLRVVFVRISLWTALGSKAFGESISFLSLPPITHFSKLSHEKIRVQQRKLVSVLNEREVLGRVQQLWSSIWQPWSNTSSRLGVDVLCPIYLYSKKVAMVLPYIQRS